MTTDEDVDLTPFPEDLILSLGRLTSFSSIAAEVWFESCHPETKQLLLNGEYIEYDDDGNAIITDRTLALLRVASEWVREPETFDMAIRVALAERHGDLEFRERVRDALILHEEILRGLEW